MRRRRVTLRKKPLEFPELRVISQRRLRRLSEIWNGLEGIAESLVSLTRTYEDFRDEILHDIKAGAPVEPGPALDELYRRKLLRVDQKAGSG